VSRDQSKGALALALAAATLTACATPVGVERADVRAVHQALTANALSAGRPSAPTVQVLHRLGLFDRFERAPDATLAELHRGLAPTGDEDRLFALAELSFLRGEDSSERSHLLAAAAYAYAFLFPGDDGTPPGPFDPRLRLASDLYNRALTGGMAAPDRTEVVLEEGTFELPFGSLEIVRASPVFRWVGYELASFVPAANFEVRGLRNRYRQRGIGAPLAASLASQFADGDPPPGHARIPVHLKVPTTALLRFESPRARLAKGRLRATLELHSPDDSRGVSIDGREVPLEFETTSALALGLEGAPVWDFELAGFRSGDFQLFGPDRLQDGLVMLHPYRPGRIPVVLVHGTASSPARWAELLNELENDPRIWERFQLWLFLYNTGNPVALSGALLREALIGALSELDPEGQDPALQRMVVIGHSQGGLLTKLTSVESGNRFWENLSEIPISELELEPATRELLQRSLFVEPLPFVRRLVFVCTPHRGSYLTVTRFVGLQPARWVAGLVELPGYFASTAVDLVALNEDRKLRRNLERIPNSIDNMTPGDPFLETLASLPIAPGVAAHSIMKASPRSWSCAPGTPRRRTPRRSRRCGASCSSTRPGRERKALAGGISCIISACD
jgi:hypothetical protein